MRKHYLLTEDGQECAGLYIWPSRAAAEAAHNAAWRATVEQRTGAAPTIRYFELQMLLDNEAGTVTEWSQRGRDEAIHRLDGAAAVPTNRPRAEVSGPSK